MKLKAYSLFDKKVGIHSLPVFFAHEAYFIRSVTELVRDLNTSVGRHPADFDLHELGEFDDNTGRFSSEGIKSLGSAVSLLAQRADTQQPMPFFGEAAQ